MLCYLFHWTLLLKTFYCLYKLLSWVCICYLISLKKLKRKEAEDSLKKPVRKLVWRCLSRVYACFWKRNKGKPMFHVGYGRKTTYEGNNLCHDLANDYNVPVPSKPTTYGKLFIFHCAPVWVFITNKRKTMWSLSVLRRSKPLKQLSIDHVELHILNV